MHKQALVHVTQARIRIGSSEQVLFPRPWPAFSVLSREQGLSALLFVSYYTLYHLFLFGSICGNAG